MNVTINLIALRNLDNSTSFRDVVYGECSNNIEADEGDVKMKADSILSNYSFWHHLIISFIDQYQFHFVANYFNKA